MTIYKDLEISFSAHPVTGDLLVVKDDEAIKASVRNIILTGFYERANRPTFGCSGKKLLFEQNDVFTQITIAESIRTALENYEPRIEINDISVSDDESGNALNISVYYTILSYRKPESINLVINRVR